MVAGSLRSTKRLRTKRLRTKRWRRTVGDEPSLKPDVQLPRLAPQTLRMARRDSFSDDVVARTAEVSYPQ